MNTPLISPLVHDVDRTLEALTEALAALDRHLRSVRNRSRGMMLTDDSPASSPLTEDGTVIRSLNEAYQAITYGVEHVDGRHAWTCPGVLALPVEVIEGPIAAVNASKAAFERAVQAINTLYVNQRGTVVDKPSMNAITWSLPQPHYADGLLPEGVYPLIRYHLAVIGRANLHLRQLWRQIHVLADAQLQPPNRLRFTWLHKRNVSRVLAGDIRKRLNRYEAQDTPAIREAQFRMSEISDREWLARIQMIPPQLQLTGIWGGMRQPNNSRRTVLAAIPVCIPMSDAVDSLVVQRPSMRRQTRKRRKIEDTPLIDFLHVYRYQAGMRTFHEPDAAEPSEVTHELSP
jgi:hypothetical protein